MKILLQKVLPIILVLFLLGGLIFLRTEKEQELIRRDFTTMGTFLRIIVPDPTAEPAVNKAYEEVERINRLFSNYIDTSLTFEVNNNPGKAVEVTPEFIKLVEKAKKYHDKSDGLFDITVGPLVDLWGFYQQKENIPSDKEIDEARDLVGLQQLEISDTTITLPRKDMQLDFGALAKGYAADRASEVLKTSGFSDHLINLGGNIYAGGYGPEDEKWTIGIQNPRAQNEIDAVLNVSDAGVGTSGDYERTFFHEGERYSHIINPVSGRPVQGVAATTVVADDALEADLLSTSLYLTTAEEGLKEIGHDTFMAVKTDNDKLSYWVTPGFQKLLSEKRAPVRNAEIIDF